MGTRTHHSSWKPVLWAIAGLTIGYLAMLAQSGQPVIARGVSCPVSDACLHGDCAQHPTCADGHCTDACPGCTNQ